MSLLEAQHPSLFDFFNSSLGAGASYTSPALDSQSMGYGIVCSMRSTTEMTHMYEESDDGITWITMHSHLVPANTPYVENHIIRARYGRAKITNGSTPNAGGTANMFHSVVQRPRNEEGRQKLVDDDNNPIASQSVLGEHFLNVNSVQQVITSTNNSTTANLASGAVYTGTGELVVASASVQVQVRCDQPIQVECQQSIDNTNWDVGDVYTLLANHGDGRTLQIVGTYFRIKITNLGTSTSTYLRAQTIYTPMMEAVPRALTPEGNMKVSIQPEGALLDAFARFRTSAPKLLFDSILTYDKQPLIWDEQTTGGATSTHFPNESSVKMVVGTASGDKVIRQGKHHVRYYPGRSQQILMTGNLGGIKSNVRSRIGYFDADNGLFFETNGSTIRVVKRSFVSGSAVDTAVNQSAWNLDRLDGTGPSGFVLDTSKQQIFTVDFEWLGSGRVRFGFILAGKIIYCHAMDHANTDSTVYMTSGKLPLRYEIENTGTSASATTMIHTCSAVMSEGGEEGHGLVRSVNNANTTRVVALGVKVPVISLRLAAANIKATLRIIDFTLFNTAADNYRLELVLNGTLTAPTWGAAPGGYAEFDTVATGITGGTLVFSDYGSGKTNTARVDFENPLLDIGSTISGTSDILSICAIPLTAGPFVAKINYEEIA